MGRSTLAQRMNELTPRLPLSLSHAEKLGKHVGVLALWLNPLSDVVFTALAQTEHFHDVRALVRWAPNLAEKLSTCEDLTLAILREGAASLRPEAGLSPELGSSGERLSAAMRDAWFGACVRWVCGYEPELGPLLSRVGDAFTRAIRDYLQAPFDIVALGSYATGSLAPYSDLDIILLVDDGSSQSETESLAQRFLALTARVHALEAPVEVDLRMRREGGHGLLVRTYAGFDHYELDRMGMSERFALGQSRLVAGRDEALKHVMRAAYALPVTPERLKELATMKRHLEAARNTPKYIRRNVKFGYGGLADIEWFCHLYEMRYPTATAAGTSCTTDERIRAIAKAGLINAIELDELLGARAHLARTRNWMWCFGYREDIVPENPDRLDRLADAMNFPDGNEFLRHHENAVEAVRGIYTEGLDRLRIEV